MQIASFRVCWLCAAPLPKALYWRANVRTGRCAPDERQSGQTAPALASHAHQSSGV